MSRNRSVFWLGAAACALAFTWLTVSAATLLDESVTADATTLGDWIPGDCVDFEDGLPEWNLYQYPSGWTASTSGPHAGAYSAAFTFPGGAGYYDAAMMSTLPICHVEAGKLYYISWWMRDVNTHDTWTSTQSILDIGINTNGMNDRIGNRNADPSTPYALPVSSEWHLVEGYVVASQTGPALLQIELHGYASSADAVWAIDDICIEPAEQFPIPLAVDIKPGSCPNPLNITGRDATDVVITFDDGRVIGESGEAFKMSLGGAQSKAVIPVAILGTGDFDVMDIDPATLMLGGVPLLRYAIEDVSTPMVAGAGECECNTLGPDGFQDLTIKFDKAAIIAAIGSVADGDVVTLTLTGVLRDGTPIEGQDCVVIHAPGLSSVFPPLDPTQAGLAPNYPNPFNPSTTIRFYLPQAAPYELTISNILGQTVRSFEGAAPAGVNAINWDGRDHSGSPVASGTYLYRLTSGDFEATRQMSLLK
jgi:hypothetical protein